MIASLALGATALGSDAVRGAVFVPATAIAAGDTHSCALTAADGVKCWGSNASGQLGDGTTASRWTPIDVSGLTSGVTAIAAGGDHTCALTVAGGVKCWGKNQHGELGDGTTTDRVRPVDVSGLGSGVTAIAAGGDHTCALTAAGGVKCWGSNVYGQLGDGTTGDRPRPVDVSGLSSGVTAIAAGGLYTCALTVAGGVKCWGWNGAGGLGDGTTSNRLTPVDVSGLTNGARAIVAGGGHSCALTAAGGVKCWGGNGFGQLGDGTTNGRATPADVAGLRSGVTMIATGDFYSCALTAAGGVKCWGSNISGQLGDGTTTDRTTPVDVLRLARGQKAITTGGAHTCALNNTGGIECWGFEANGELGTGGPKTFAWTPVDVTGLGSGTKAIAAGFNDSCALTAAGGVKCWGDNLEGQLGDGTTKNRSTPIDVTGLTSGASGIAAGAAHTCALVNGDGVKCWGSGQLGDGTTSDHSKPVEVVGLRSGVSAIAAGVGHSCALAATGDVKCWGSNLYGQLGDGTTTNGLTPVDVSGLGSGVTAIAAGLAHSCSLTVAGGVKCWGGNWVGQLGDGSTGSRLTPVDVSGLGDGVTAVAAGGVDSCALTAAGGVKCWGNNLYGQLGDGTTSNHLTPVDVSGLSRDVTAIADGGDHSCALTVAGAVRCWGKNQHGELGDGTTTNRLTPVDVSGLSSGVTAIAAGNDHTCALTSAGSVKCWGYNGYGQLGVATQTGPSPWIPDDVVGFDTTAPRTTIASGPSSRTRDSTPTFSFSADETASFACRIDAARFTACTSPYTTPVLAGGKHKFEARATDAAGNVGAAARRMFTVVAGAAQATLAIVSRSVTVSQSRIAGIELRCGARTSCQGMLTLTAEIKGEVVASSARRLRLSVGRRAFSVPAGRAETVKVRLTSRSFTLLVRLRRLPLRARAAFRRRPGVTATVTRMISLIAPKQAAKP